MTDYARPEVLVDTQWVADHLKDPKVRVIEVSVDQSAFDQGHIPGAVGLNWFHDLEERPHRDIASKATITERSNIPTGGMILRKGRTIGSEN